jgi:hypothetical protein
MSDESLTIESEKIILKYIESITERLNHYPEENISIKKTDSNLLKKLFGEDKLFLKIHRKKNKLCILTFDGIDYCENNSKIKLSLNAEFFSPFFWAMCEDTIQKINDELNSNHTVLNYNFKTYLDINGYGPLNLKKPITLKDKILNPISEKILRIICR